MSRQDLSEFKVFRGATIKEVERSEAYAPKPIIHIPDQFLSFKVSVCKQKNLDTLLTYDMFMYEYSDSKG